MFILITVTSSTELICFRRKYGKSSPYRGKSPRSNIFCQYPLVTSNIYDDMLKPLLIKQATEQLK